MSFRNVFLHLRFGFSIFLMPVFLFALSQSQILHWPDIILIFLILHLMVFPSSNAYNSLMDKDTGSIGGLQNPPAVPQGTFYITLFMDFISVILSYLINYQIALLVLSYILISRAYSYRKIRLKKYPIAAFLSVTIMQGAGIYLISWMVMNNSGIYEAVKNTEVLTAMLFSTLLIGAAYPLTQIYQHQQDKEDGVKTISFLLGYKGTFLFSGTLLLLLTAILYMFYNLQNTILYFYLFLIFALPIVLYFTYWMIKVFKDHVYANFKNTMKMNLISAVCLNLYFIVIFLMKHIAI